ncbi:MAG: Ig-like domain-containing protein [Solirubrobacterales bacterium]
MPLVPGRRRTATLLLALVGLIAWGSLAPAVPTAAAVGNYNWYPGYYVLANTDSAARKQAILDDPLVGPFTGVQFRYQWAASELSPGDYSAGFAALDADLERVAAKGKKLMVMLMYKKSDGTAAVPADLLSGSGAWCSGSSCGQFTPDSDHAIALLWNPVVEARLNAWITAMAQHLSESPYLDSVAGVVFNETSLSTTDTNLLAAADYDPDVYIQAIEDNLLAVTTAAPKLFSVIYFEGGFVSMDGSSVDAGQKIGDWMLLNPRTGAGVSDLIPKDPKGPNHPCANAAYQASIVCAPAVESNDYSLDRTDSFEQSFAYGTDPVPNGLHASFLTFSYVAGSGPNAFTFADVSNSIASHPIPNTTRPWPVTTVNQPPVAADDTGAVVPGGTLDQPAPGLLGNDVDPDGDPLAVTTTPVTSPANGSLTLHADGSYSYVHDGGSTNGDSFVYEVCDTGGLCDTAKVDLAVVTPSADRIFADSFGSGDLSAWSSSRTDLGDLSVRRAAGMAGKKGMQAKIDDNAPIYVTDDSPSHEPRYRARFSFDPNSISMAAGDSFHIFDGYSGRSTDVLSVRLRFRGGAYQLGIAVRNDHAAWKNTGWFAIDDAPVAIELDWVAATARGANDGELTFWLDGVPQTTVTGVNDDTRRIDRVRLGAVSGVDRGTRGTSFFDAFTSQRQLYIGP